MLNALGGYREFSPAADYDLVLRALERGVRIGNLPDVVLKYRVLSDSVSHRSRQRTLTYARAVKRMSRLRRRGRLADEQATLSVAVGEERFGKGRGSDSSIAGSRS